MDAFVSAFNAGDLDALAACVSTDAVAQVDGAPFPQEVGRAMIRDTSFQYLLGLGLRARAVDHPDAAVVLLDEDGCVDMAVRIEEADGHATSLLYYTLPHRREIVAAIARDLGLDEVRGDDLPPAE